MRTNVQMSASRAVGSLAVVCQAGPEDSRRQPVHAAMAECSSKKAKKAKKEIPGFALDGLLELATIYVADGAAR